MSELDNCDLDSLSRLSIFEQLSGEDTMLTGDSAVEEKWHEMTSFLERLDKVMRLVTPATLVLDDPAGNSYIQVCTGRSTFVHKRQSKCYISDDNHVSERRRQLWR